MDLQKVNQYHQNLCPFVPFVCDLWSVQVFSFCVLLVMKLPLVCRWTPKVRKGRELMASKREREDKASVVA